ncbi:sulfatase-like hydrolase/transferase [Planctomycetota bacterium]
MAIKNKRRFWGFVLFFCLACSALPAASIAWSPAVDSMDKSQLIEGEIVLALNGGDSITITEGGTSGRFTYTFVETSYADFSFAPTPGDSIIDDISNGAPSTGDADFDSLLRSFTYSVVGIKSGTQTIGGLTAGAEYEIQVFYNDQRLSRVMTFGDGEVSPHNVDIASQGSGWGQFATGSFTATGNTQSLTHIANGFANVHVNAVLVVKPGPPASPEVPTQLVATKGDTEVDLDWADNTQYGFSHFLVKRSLSPGGPYSPIPGATPSESYYVDTGLTNLVTYYYVVSAVNALAQESAHSNEASATPEIFIPPAPEVPTDLGVRPGNNRLTLDWADNIQPGFLEFRVKRSLISGGPYTQIGTSTLSHFVDSTARNDTTYYYVVTAVNIADHESAPSLEQAGTPSVSATPPNFLFIIADDMDTYAVNAYRRTEPNELDASGNFYRVDTPHIDRLAAEGMLFHQARLMGANSGAVCTPSRTTIMSGKNSWQRTQGVTAATTFPGIFNRGARAGQMALPYATYRTCKNGNSYPTANKEFTVVNDASKRGNTDGSGSEWHGDHGVAYVEDWATKHRANGKPFLIYLGFSHPHDTRNARETPNLTGRYGCINTSRPEEIVFNSEAPPLPYNHLFCTPNTYPAHPFDHGGLTIRDEVSVSGIGLYRTEAVVRNEIGRNFACTDWIDQQIGRVLARLDDPDGDGDTSDSVKDNTYIVFTSDHGIAIGRHGLQGKQNLYEHTWRVPYIVRGPGIQAGSETQALIYLHETFPTFCDLAGIDIPDTIDENDGQSFRAVLEGTSDTHHDVLYGLYAGSAKPGIRAVTDGRYKLIKYDVTNNATQVTQLFDLQENPFELLPEHGVPNLATDAAYAPIRQYLEERLTETRVKFSDPYAFLGDRTLLRFEDGLEGQPAETLVDRFPLGNNGQAISGNGGAGPVFSTDVPHANDFVVGETNTRSLDFEQDSQNYIQIPDGRGLDFGQAPFTIEAWIKFESMPTGADLASVRPVVMKKVIGASDASMDYMFLAACGSFGSRRGYANMALLLGSTPVVSRLAISDSGWHYISVAFDPVMGLVRFILDDQTDMQSTSAAGSANAGPLVIGAHFNNAGIVDSAFDGLIDELSITDGFLTETELQPLRSVLTP